MDYSWIIKKSKILRVKRKSMNFKSVKLLEWNLLHINEFRSWVRKLVLIGMRKGSLDMGEVYWNGEWINFHLLLWRNISNLVLAFAYVVSIVKLWIECLWSTFYYIWVLPEFKKMMSISMSKYHHVIYLYYISFLWDWCHLPLCLSKKKRDPELSSF